MLSYNEKWDKNSRIRLGPELVIAGNMAYTDHDDLAQNMKMYLPTIHIHT